MPPVSDPNASDDISITLSNVGVRYPVPRFIRGQARRDNPRPGSGGIIQVGKQLFVDAVKTVDLKVETGTKLGLLGANGAGKSTMLRIMTGIFPPTTGSIKVVGRIGSMLDINTGFDQNETGVDNIFLRGIFMGIERSTIQKRIGPISAFSGLGDYLNMPLFSYSSGMRARLSFAIATGFDVDLVIMDEWLSTGDASFRTQAENHMNNYVEQASILVIASHSVNLLKKVCNRVIVMDSGSIIFDGSVEKALHFYDEHLKEIEPPVAAQSASDETKAIG